MFICHLLVGQDLTYEQYTVNDGLPSMKIYDVVQDSAKVLWIGTENGLVSYDSDKFLKHSHPELIDNDIIEIALNRNGRIYFLNISEQLGYLKNDSIIIINTSGLIHKIFNIVSRKDKDYLVGNKKPGGRIIFEIKELSNHTFEFIPTNINSFQTEKTNTFSLIEPGKYLSNLDSTILLRDEKSYRHLISGNEKYVFNEVFILTDLLKVDQSLYDKTKELYFTRIMKNKDAYYIMGNKGITYYNSKTQTFRAFLGEMKINTIFFDSENNTWISTPSNGLLRVSNLLAKLNQKQSKLHVKDGVNDIHQDINGNIYLGLISNEVVINPFRESKRIKISENERPVHLTEYHSKIIAYSDNGIAIVDSKTLNGKVSKINSQGLKTLLIEDSFVYAGFTFGLIKRPYNEYFDHSRERDKKMYFHGSRISFLHKSKDSKTIFIGTPKNLFQTNVDSLELASIKVQQSINVSCIVDGIDNSIWVGTKAKGIFNIKNDSISSILNIENGLISNSVNNLELNKDELLVSTNTGLCIINLSTNNIKIINEYNFLPSNEVFVCKVINEEYWIGTIEGLTILSKEDIFESTTTGPFLSLKNLFINGVKTDYESEMELDHSVNNIQLNFQNISYKSGLEKYIKYRIPKIDSSWITTIDPNLRLPSLKPGDYHIEAIGINAIGLKSKPLNIYFKINPPWWKTIWAKILGVLAILGIGNLILIYRSKRIRKEETTKREYLGQLNKIKDQALQLQMNPHFIFNSLNAIQGFIGTDEEEMAMNYLARFARLIRLIFEHSKGNTISLEQELEFTNLYLNLEKLRFKDKVNVNIKIEAEVLNNKDIIDVPPLLIQPIIENSFKHGLFHKKGKGNLSIEYTLQKNILQVTIQDDGVGRAQSMKISQLNSEKQTSSGIKTTLERIDLLNFGKEKNKNSIEIEDLYDIEGNANGTKTILNLSI